MFKMYNVHSHSFIVAQPIKITFSGKAGPNYIVYDSYYYKCVPINDACISISVSQLMIHITISVFQLMILTINDANISISVSQLMIHITISVFQLKMHISISVSQLMIHITISVFKLMMHIFLLVCSN